MPFLDENFANLCMQKPPELKLRNEGKHPLKAVARGLIPDAIIDQVLKVPFPLFDRIFYIALRSNQTLYSPIHRFVLQ